MPTYEIQAPNGRTYQIDGPTGASQSDVQAQVLQQFPDAGGTSAPTPKPLDAPNAVTRGYQDYVAKPLTWAVEKPLRGMTAPLVDAARVANGESPAQVLRYNTSRLEHGNVKGIAPDEKQKSRPFADA